MKGYEKLASILGVELDQDICNVREKLRNAIYKRFDSRSLNVLESLSVIELPINIEVAEKIYDLNSIDEFFDFGLIERRGNYLIIDETLRDLISKDKVEYHRKALEYYENLGRSIDVETERSYHLLMIGDYERSFELFMKTANEIYGKHRCVEKLIFIGEKLIGKIKEEDRLLGTLGNLYMVLRRYEEAESYYKRVLKMYERTNDERILGVMLNLANLYYVKGDYRKAEELLKECVTLSTDEEITENALLILTSLYIDLKDFEMAEKCLMDVLRMEHSRAKIEAERIGRVASILNNLGFVYSRRRDFEKAERFYKEALRIYNEINDVKGFVTVLNNLCSLYVVTENFEKARGILKTIEKVSEFPMDLKAKYHFLKAKILERDGDLSRALENYMKSGIFGFLVFRNFGMNAVNYIHALDKAEEIAKKIGMEDTAGDLFLIKSVIGKVYFGIRGKIDSVKCGDRGKIILKALEGEEVEFDVKDEIDFALYVITRDLRSVR